MTTLDIARDVRKLAYALKYGGTQAYCAYVHRMSRLHGADYARRIMLLVSN